MSCNGCRVLRKGCSDTCVLRQCLRAIEGGDAQGHATAFLAKFFGRAAMMAFINAVPDSQRAALFQSLLYEACGRTVNPVHGLLGLLCSGNWHVCQEAVRSVLGGGNLCPCPEAIAKAATDNLSSFSMMPFFSPSHMTPHHDLCDQLSSWQKHGMGGGPHGQQGIAQAGSQSRSESPKGSVICPLPMKRRCVWDKNFDVKEKLLDSESLSAGSTDQQERKITHTNLKQHQQQQLMMMMTDPLKNPEFCSPKQEQLIKRQLSEKDSNLQRLELTLSTPPCLPLQPVIGPSEARRPSNPSCISLESEGSVTSLDSAKVSKKRCTNPKQIFDLLL